MNEEVIFQICNLLVVPGWILLVAAPRWKWTVRLTMFVIPAALACIYTFLFVATFEGLRATVPSLDMLSYLLRTKSALLSTWVHFLALDLFAGAWMVRDSQQSKIAHAAVIPCLVLTFLLGPIGLLVYIAARATIRRATRTP